MAATLTEKSQDYRILAVNKRGAPQINLHIGETILPSCSCLITGIISTSLTMPLLDSESSA